MGTGQEGNVARRKSSVVLETVLADMEWVASTLPDPLDVIDRCVDTVVVHWDELNMDERRRVLDAVNDRFVTALDADQSRGVVVAA
jgi:hypothetical protein